MFMVKESFVNLDTNTLFGETPYYEAYTDQRGELFRSCQREYGRCTSKMYRDTPDGTKEVGWVFLKRDTYEGGGRRGETTYLREVWVEVQEEEDNDGA